MKTFTPYEDPIPKMIIQNIKLAHDEDFIHVRMKSFYSKFPIRCPDVFRSLCLAMYNNGFKDGVKAHKKEVSKHCNKLMDYFGI